MVAIFFYWSFVFGSARTLPLTAIPEVSFDAGVYDEAAYTTFLSNLRGKLKSKVVSHTIPVLPVTVPVDSDKRYVLAILKSETSTTTIALDVINAYVLGFKVNTKSYFFSDVDKDIYESKRLFGDTKKARLPYGGGYQALHNAGASRENVPLGISQINNAIFQLVKYATTTPQPNIASNLLVIIQMLSEAARFKYIEQKVVDNFFNDFLPRGDVISLENNWGALSVAIQTSTGGKFSPIQLQHADYKPYTVSTVTAVQDKMGLLLAKENLKCLHEMPWPYNGEFVTNFFSMF